MVASPGDEMPSRDRIFQQVSARILRSSSSDTWSTYHTSSSNLFSQDSTFLPFTCAQPVIPGRTS